MSNYYSLYCDESGIHSGKSFYIGCLYCTNTRESILDSKINKFREINRYYREFKWNELKDKKRTQLYIEFLNIFLDDPYARFFIMSVTKGHSWQKWGKDENERFFKVYYVFLRMHTGSNFNKYHIYVDDKEGKPYRWTSLKFAVNRGIDKKEIFTTKKQIRKLIPMESKQNNLIQLTDMILGSVTSTATSQLKSTLIRHVKEHLNDYTKSGSHKFKRIQWAPRK